MYILSFVSKAAAAASSDEKWFSEEKKSGEIYCYYCSEGRGGERLHFRQQTASEFYLVVHLPQ